MRVPEGANARSVAGSGCESLEGSTALDSRMGTVHGICPWGIALVMSKFDGGGVLGGLWMGFLWGPCRRGTGAEKRQHQGTYIRVIFAGRHTLSNSPIFFVICYILSSGGFTASCFKTIGNGVPEP